MFKFDPVSSEDYIRMQQPFQEGEYDFHIDLCEQKLSQSGNNMIVAYISIFNPLGKSLTLKDYLLPDHAQMKYKLRQLCECVGIEKQYETGTLSLDSMKGQRGKCFIKHEKEQNGDRLFCRVKYYIKQNNDKKADPTPFNDDIPF